MQGNAASGFQQRTPPSVADMKNSLMRLPRSPNIARFF